MNRALLVARGEPEARLVVPGTPVGDLVVVATPHGIRLVSFSDGGKPPYPHLPTAPDQFHLTRAKHALEWMFDQGSPAEEAPEQLVFDLAEITTFQAWVYEELLTIGRGQVVTYGELATRWGDATASRAVGQAMGANPAPVLIPCHRVVMAEGRLGGFGGGLERKVTLLRLEGIDVEGSTPESRVHPGALRLFD